MRRLGAYKSNQWFLDREKPLWYSRIRWVYRAYRACRACRDCRDFRPCRDFRDCPAYPACQYARHVSMPGMSACPAYQHARLIRYARHIRYARLIKYARLIRYACAFGFAVFLFSFDFLVFVSCLPPETPQSPNASEHPIRKTEIPKKGRTQTRSPAESERLKIRTPVDRLWSIESKKQTKKSGIKKAERRKKEYDT